MNHKQNTQEKKAYKKQGVEYTVPEKPQIQQQQQSHHFVAFLQERLNGSGYHFSFVPGKGLSRLQN
jgi:hypothetical protein